MRPYFIGIGAYKAGTSWISQCLAEHPSVFLPVKETYFFSNDALWARGQAWYEAFFADCPQGSRPGEFCPGYLCDPSAPERIASLYPHAKIVACLRNPVDRAFSHYLHDIRYGRIPASVPFRAALSSNPAYLAHGLYGAAVARYCSFFPPDQLLVFPYEDIARCPQETVSRIYSFLGIDAAHTPPSLWMRAHARRMPRSVLIEALFSRWWLGIIRFSARSHLHFLPRLIRQSSLIPLFFRLNVATRFSWPALSPAERRFLEQYFTSDIRLLERQLGISFSGWILQE